VWQRTRLDHVTPRFRRISRVRSFNCSLFATINSMNPAFASAFEEHAAVLSQVRQTCLEPLERLIEEAITRLSNSAKILFFGNGGSAADAQHFATELTIRFAKDRRALAGLALTTDTSALTACGNDFGFDQVFSRQIEALGRAGDLAIAFSTSGNSPNILAAVRQAKASGIFAAAFTGDSGGKLRGAVDLLIAVPSNSTARIQEMHSLLGHLLCQEIEARLA
jgi:D-sedoheptulose 7-phosphate isomerase